MIQVTFPQVVKPQVTKTVHSVSIDLGSADITFWLQGGDAPIAENLVVRATPEQINAIMAILEPMPATKDNTLTVAVQPVPIPVAPAPEEIIP